MELKESIHVVCTHGSLEKIDETHERAMHSAEMLRNVHDSQSNRAQQDAYEHHNPCNQRVAMLVARQATIGGSSPLIAIAARPSNYLVVASLTTVRAFGS